MQQFETIMVGLTVSLLASLLQSNMAPETPVGLFNCPQVAAGFLSFVEISYHHCAWPSRI